MKTFKIETESIFYGTSIKNSKRFEGFSLFFPITNYYGRIMKGRFGKIIFGESFELEMSFNGISISYS